MQRTFLYLLIILIICGCDVMDEPYLKTNGDGIEPVDTAKPKMLLEEFTGHKCPNCPNGAKIAHELQNIYGDNLIIVSIHAGIQARPDKNSDKFNYDFRTHWGDSLENIYKTAQIGQPAGLINRSYFDGINNVIQANGWPNVISSYIDTVSPAKVKFVNLIASYDDASRTISVQLDMKWLETTENCKLSVWIVEDSITNWQISIDPPYELSNYAHNNVLRYSFNNTWGDILQETTSGTTINKNYSYTLPLDCDWKVSKLKIIAFVYDDESGVKNVEQTKYLIQ